MPCCEGRPNGPCPNKVNNGTVKLSQGDLMLCKECDNFRFPSFKTVSTADVLQITPAGDKPATVNDPPLAKPATEQSSPEPKVVVNELLFFVNNKFDCLARDVIHSTIADFFREDEILAAKQISQYIDICQPATIQPLLKKRIGENKIDRTIDDLLSIFCVIDENGTR